MSYTLYTDDVSNQYRDLAENAREKMSVLISLTTNYESNSKYYESNSKLALKYYNLAVICDNIANNRLSDTDYVSALLEVEAAMLEVNNTQSSYMRDLHAEMTESLAYEP